jgi:peptidoglycan/LPS O-acetylase OafA/YrhL
MHQALKTDGSAGRSASYMNQLDTVRTVAVGMVIVSHWAPSTTTFWFSGFVGVQLFFVISGFLITGILLDARRKAERLGIYRSAVLKSFYVRRFLRIFPLFYATLAVAFLAGFPTVRASIWWLIPYLSNALFALRGRWIGEIAHFWSLSVEEQFYLIWPVLILFTSKRLLLPLITSAIVFAPVFRFVCYVLGTSGIAVAVLPFSSLDTLGLGAMLALLLQNSAGEREDKGLMVLRVVSIVGCFAYFALNIAGLFKELPVFLSWIAGTMIAPTALGLVWLAARGVRGPVGRFMEWAPLVYLGRISYGLYILHPFISPGVSKVFRILGLPKTSALNAHLLFALNLTVLVGVSSLSWHFFEKRINGLKRFFPYVSPSTTDMHSSEQQYLVRV